MSDNDRKETVKAIGEATHDFMASNFFMGEPPLNNAEVETLAEGIADRLARRPEPERPSYFVVVTTYGGCYHDTDIFASEAGRGAFLVEKLKGKLPKVKLTGDPAKDGQKLLKKFKDSIDGSDHDEDDYHIDLISVQP